jgi:hypothetical protein
LSPRYTWQVRRLTSVTQNGSAPCISQTCLKDPQPQVSDTHDVVKNVGPAFPLALNVVHLVGCCSDVPSLHRLSLVSRLLPFPDWQEGRITCICFSAPQSVLVGLSGTRVHVWLGEECLHLPLGQEPGRTGYTGERDFLEQRLGSLVVQKIINICYVT